FVCEHGGIVADRNRDAGGERFRAEKRAQSLEALLLVQRTLPTAGFTCRPAAGSFPSRCCRSIRASRFWSSIRRCGHRSSAGTASPPELRRCCWEGASRPRSAAVPCSKRGAPRRRRDVLSPRLSSNRRLRPLLLSPL